MSETAFVDEDKFVTSREGVLIPDVDMEEFDPWEFVEFFDDVLSANTDYHYFAETDFVIPPSGQKPLVLMRHTAPSEGIYMHNVLTPPEQPGEFNTFLGIYYRGDLQRVEVTTKEDGGLTSSFTSPGRDHHSNETPTSWWLNGKEISQDDKHHLGNIAASFVELIF